jgi:hypothetical protein
MMDAHMAGRLLAAVQSPSPPTACVVNWKAAAAWHTHPAHSAPPALPHTLPQHLFLPHMPTRTHHTFLNTHVHTQVTPLPVTPLLVTLPRARTHLRHLGPTRLRPLRATHSIRVRHSAVQYRTVHCTALHCTALHCTAPDSIPVTAHLCHLALTEPLTLTRLHTCHPDTH